MTAPEDTPGAEDRHEFTGRDVLYREGAITALDVQRAADALLRQGAKPSVAALREQLGGGSPNTITPLLAKYWETLGARLGNRPGIAGARAREPGARDGAPMASCTG